MPADLVETYQVAAPLVQVHPRASAILVPVRVLCRRIATNTATAITFVVIHVFSLSVLVYTFATITTFITAPTAIMTVDFGLGVCSITSCIPMLSNAYPCDGLTVIRTEQATVTARRRRIVISI